LAGDEHEVFCGLFADAQPNGTTVRSAYEALRDELIVALVAAMPIDAVILPLHGAMVAEEYPDCEGDIVEHVRAIVGSGVPIGVELDLHCHFTERLQTSADIVIAYKEYPHTDVDDRFEELWGLTIETARGNIRPVTASFDCRMTGMWHTTREPMRSLVEEMQAIERQPGVLSVSFGHGFPWGDVVEAGARTWVVTDGDLPRAARLAEGIASEVWKMRAVTKGPEVDLATALGHVTSARPGAPIVIADIADNPGGGAAGDSSFILRELVDRAIGDVAIGAFWDVGAIQICREAGLGARLALRVGGKCGPLSGNPVDLQVTVRNLVEDHGQSALGSPFSPCGPSVWVSSDSGLDLVLISRRQQVYGTDIFTGLGIDLATKRAIVVKSSQHFHAAFAPLASEVLYVDTPGMLRSDFAAIPYRHRNPNYWPRVPDPWGAEGPPRQAAQQ